MNPDAQIAPALQLVVGIMAARNDRETLKAIRYTTVATLSGALGMACGMLTAALEDLAEARGLDPAEELARFLSRAGLKAAMGDPS